MPRPLREESARAKTRRESEDSVPRVLQLDHDYALRAAVVEDLVTAIARDAPSQANRVRAFVKQVIKDAKRRDARVDERILDLRPIRAQLVEMRFLSWPEVETLASWMRDD
jgi:hypothetical protein